MYAIDEVLQNPAALAEFADSLATLDPNGLRCAKIKITSRCNLRCQMCDYWQTRHETSLDTAAWRAVLDGLRESGCRKVHFSGGEVFLRRDFLDIVEHASGVGLKVNMTTNGTLLGRERVKRLVRARPNSISLSLDGPRAEIHDRIRGIPGSFDRTCRVIREIRRRGERFGRIPRIRINFVIMRENWRRSAQMVELARALGATELHPMPVDEKGEAKRRLSRGQIETYNRELAPQVAELRAAADFSTHDAFVFPFGKTEEEIRLARKGLYARGFYARHACLAPWTHLFIAWDGECYLCCMTNGRMRSLGNVRNGVRSVFWGAEMRAVRAAFRSGRMHPACHRCDMFLTENQALHEGLTLPR
jgi:radical SAM protein with 4Fe4S-binding SPASM domain